MRNNHSQMPVIPPGAMSTYMIVVKGKKMRPNIGQIHQMIGQPIKAAFHRPGRKSQKIIPAMREPAKNSMSKKQHMLTSFRLQLLNFSQMLFHRFRALGTFSFPKNQAAKVPVSRSKTLRKSRLLPIV
jgi:hypothetical protein